MYNLTTSYVYLVLDGVVYYSASNYVLTLDMAKASFFSREADAKARITNMKKNIKRRGLFVDIPYDTIYSFDTLYFHTVSYSIAQPNIDFSA